jgi:YidC/Oxa1 family membrane protein insertase
MIQGVVEFPSHGDGWFPFIGDFVYWLIGSIHAGGVVSYGLAVIIFTFILKLVLLPLDFGNKYFQKKNAAQMAKFKPEEDALKEQYADNPMQFNRARQELYRKNGYKMGGFCLFTILNMFVTLSVFLSVFGALRAVSTYNIKLTSTELNGVYRDFEDNIYLQDDEYNPDFAGAVNEVYKKHNIGFLWIKNIWKSDIPIESSNLTFAEYSAYVAVSDEELEASQYETANEFKRAQYDIIFGAVDGQQKRNWNGLFLLIILAGAMTYLSVVLNSKFNQTKKPEPKKLEAQYSMRDIKKQQDAQMPSMDPAMINKIMKFMLPAIMVIFTLTSTSALAIYIIANSLFSTIFTIGLNYPVNAILKFQEKRAKDRGDTHSDPDIINPHAKYFKGSR